MKCSDPVLKHENHYRNWSMASPIFRMRATQVFNCGKCLSCRRNHANSLAMRSVLTSSLYERNSFLTLTYDEGRPGYTNEKTYRDIQLFKKRLRKWASLRYKVRLQIFNVMEYGKNGKKHWHVLVFGCDFSDDRRLFTVSGSHPLYISEKLSRLWGLGFCTIGDVSLGSALYQTQYTQKDIKNRVPESRKSSSRHSGLGREFFLKNYRQILQLGYVPFDGRKAAIPRYFMKIAHKHYCHFYDRSYFFIQPRRKTRYKFLCVGANKEMADLFKIFLAKRSSFIEDQIKGWEDTVKPHLFSGRPDFVKAGENASYDLSNKMKKEIF